MQLQCLYTTFWPPGPSAGPETPIFSPDPPSGTFRRDLILKSRIFVCKTSHARHDPFETTSWDGRQADDPSVCGVEFFTASILHHPYKLILADPPAENLPPGVVDLGDLFTFQTIVRHLLGGGGVRWGPVSSWGHAGATLLWGLGGTGLVCF